jgi:hypothetical protein
MRYPKSVLRIFAMLAIVIGPASGAFACRVAIDFSAVMPPNVVEIRNEDRLRLADTVLRTRVWPDEAIASALTPAFANERNPAELAKKRAAGIKAYLIQLGIKEQNIFTDANVLSQLEAPSKEARERLRDVYIEFTPQCYGHCAQLCEGTYTPKQ